MTRGDVLVFLRLNKSVFKTEMGITKLGLFGSLARNQVPNDIAIIVEFEDDTQNLFGKKIKLKEIIESEFHLMVDVCQEQYIKPSAKPIIMRDAIFV
jgi:uncharacterized protein